MTQRLWEMPFDEIRDYINDGNTGLVIPFGTVEPHGPHLPVGTDNFLAQGLGEDIAEKFNWLMAPTLNYGINNSLAIYPGATTISDDTYEKFVFDLVAGYIKLGFTHIVFCNGHGGNTDALKKTASMLTREYPVARIIAVDWWYLDKGPREEVYGKASGHAGIDETAAVIHYNNEFVKRDKFNENSSWTWTTGMSIYPAPASCLVMEDDALPDFDEKKASVFMEKVVAIILAKIERALVCFENNIDFE